jgi:hypothetical protein
LPREFALRFGGFGSRPGTCVAFRTVGRSPQGLVLRFGRFFVACATQPVLGPRWRNASSGRGRPASGRPAGGVPPGESRRVDARQGAGPPLADATRVRAARPVARWRQHPACTSDLRRPCAVPVMEVLPCATDTSGEDPG